MAAGALAALALATLAGTRGQAQIADGTEQREAGKSGSVALEGCGACERTALLVL